MMDLIKQAFDLEQSKKEKAIELYKKSVCELANKNYVMRIDDAHTELSAIFGEKWLLIHSNNSNYGFSSEKYAESNVAFNYANFRLGTDNKFINLAKDLVDKDTRVIDSDLKRMAKEMNCVLTATTPKAIEESFLGM